MDDMLRRGGLPPDVDATTTDEIARTFLIVRIVRGSLLLLFLLIALAGVIARGWPTGVAVAVALTAVLQLGRLASSVRRFGRVGRPIGDGGS